MRKVLRELTRKLLALRIWIVPPVRTCVLADSARHTSACHTICISA
jgi:hypothetical protein